MLNNSLKNTAWVFPGQGSQYVGMGHDLYENFPEARAVIDAADVALGTSLSQLMFEGPEDTLTDTVNAQPAILTHSIAALRVIQNALDAPLFTAGHSLGEYSALVAAGALDFADALKLVRARGEAMQRAGAARPGAMAAILGLDDIQLVSICEQAGAVQVANFNAPGQTVLSGEKDALERAVEMAKEAGAKRAITLAVSIAAHSKLMQPAAAEFMTSAMGVPLQTSKLQVVANVNAQPLEDAEAMRAEMLAQLTSSVQWVKSIEFMVARGVEKFVEIGPKDVLAGLIRRITKEASAQSIGNVASVNTLLQGAPA